MEPGQLQPGTDRGSLAVYPLVAAGLLIVIGFRRITTAVPSPWVAIVLLTVLAVVAGIDVPTVQLRQRRRASHRQGGDRSVCLTPVGCLNYRRAGRGTEKYRRHGLEVELTSLNSASIQMRERLAGKLNAGE